MNKKNRKNNLLGKIPDEIEFSDQIKFVLITLNKTLQIKKNLFRAIIN